MLHWHAMRWDVTQAHGELWTPLGPILRYETEGDAQVALDADRDGYDGEPPAAEDPADYYGAHWFVFGPCDCSP